MSKRISGEHDRCSQVPFNSLFYFLPPKNREDLPISVIFHLDSARIEELSLDQGIVDKIVDPGVKKAIIVRNWGNLPAD